MASLLVLAHCLIVLERGDITCISEKTEVLNLPSPLLETYLQLLFFLPLSSSTCLVPGAGMRQRNNLTCSMLAHCASGGSWPLPDGQGEHPLAGFLSVLAKPLIHHVPAIRCCTFASGNKQLLLQISVAVQPPRDSAIRTLGL